MTTTDRQPRGPARARPSSRALLAAGAALGLLGGAGGAQAYDLPAVNLGSTSFYDGAPAPSGPGWYGIEYLTFVRASRLKDGQGRRLGLPREKIELLLPITQVLYVSPSKWRGLQPGFSVILPWMAHARVDDGLGGAALRGGTGLGDVTFGPFVQFAPVMGTGGPVFSHRFEFDLIAPTGRYERGNAVNPGSNFWSVSPHWSFTWWATPRLSFSGRLHYLWNARNSSPPASLGPDARSMRAGQAVHANFTAEYSLRQGLSVGLNGYWLRQITDTRVNGADVAGRRERVWAIGPGLLYAFSPDTSMLVNLYAEQDARNRAQGTRAVLRLNHHF